jgi:hypothetical protein
MPTNSVLHRFWQSPSPVAGRPDFGAEDDDPPRHEHTHDDRASQDDTPVSYDHDCPVCFHPFSTRPRVVPPCGHSVCLTCLFQLRAPQTCPLCRADLATYMPVARGGGSAFRRTRRDVPEDDDDDVPWPLRQHATRGAGTDAAAEELLHRARLSVVLDDALSRGAAPRNHLLHALAAPPRAAVVDLTRDADVDPHEDGFIISSPTTPAWDSPASDDARPPDVPASVRHLLRILGVPDEVVAHRPPPPLDA